MTDQQPIDRLKSGFTPPASKLLGVDVQSIDVEAGIAVVAFTAKPEFCNPMGVVQGGFQVAMLDDAMAIAAVAKSGFSMFVPTLELKTSFLKPALPGRLIATAKVLQWGKSTVFLEARLHDEAGTLLSAATATAKLVPRDKMKKPAP
jgi:uncharacterized protein (TIGR00369 family)